MHKNTIIDNIHTREIILLYYNRMEVYPSSFKIYKDTFKKVRADKTPLQLRLMSYSVMVIHIVLAFTYVYAILYSSDIKMLYLVLFGCFILYEITIYYKRCVLSRYEEINSDIVPTMSEILCHIFSGNTDMCKEPHKFEIFFVSMGIALPIVKLFGIYIVDNITGKRYTCKLK
jgi:hypothetical protein